MLINETITVLLIEDEDYDVIRVKNTIAPFEDKIKIKDIVSDGNAALELFRDKTNNYDVVIMDYHLTGGVMERRTDQKN